jgi:pyruvate dehydrogenase E1 component alpha subunit
MNSLQRQGRIGTYASLAGQEGSQFGTMYAVEDTDWLIYQYREHGTVIDRGSLAEYVRYWMGHEAGNAAIVDHNVAPLNISIGAQVPHATGLAWASKLEGDDNADVCHFGDGATSEGDFHEGS